MRSTKNDILNKISTINEFNENVNIMEVCGSHTMAISKFGIRSLLKPNINLISGPGCPVCVTPDIYLDYVYKLSLNEGIIIATYGDMIRVPGSKPEYTLEKAKALGAEVKMVYSSLDALEMACDNPNKKVVFMGIGFETTTPATAIAVKEAQRRNIDNFYVLSVHKRVEPVMKLLLQDKELRIDGFLIPGHVAAIIGEEGFKFLDEYNCNGVITGFESEEIVDGIFELIKCIKNKEYHIKNVYRKLVKENGNLSALNVINEVFEVKADLWRGMGMIPESGLKLKDVYSKYDIEKLFPIDFSESKGNSLCQCGDVLKGKIKPSSCKLFRKLCTPENPIGPCMVSGEGSCAAYYRYQLI